MQLSNLFKRITTGNERSVKVKKNFIASLGIKGVSIAVTFFLVPVTLGYVSDELYGIWLILSSLLMMVHYFDVGFTFGLKNKLTEAIANNDMQRSKALVSTTYLMMFLIFIPLCIILECATPFIPWAKFFNVSEIYNSEIILALQIMFVCVCFQMIVNTLVSVLSAYQRTAMAALFPVLGNVVSLIVIVLLSKFTQPSLAKLALAISTMPVIVLTIASLFLYSSTYKDIAPSLKSVKFNFVNDIFGLGAKFFLIQIQIIVLYQSANILISNVSNPIVVANYNVSYRYINVALMVFSILMTPIWPAFTDAYVKGDYSWMRNVYSKLTKILFATIGIIFLMVVASPLVYKLWIGDKMDIPISMTIAVAIFIIAFSWNSMQTTLINGIGAVKLQTCITLIGLLCYIPLALCFGHIMGGIGIVYAMATVYFIYSCIFTIQLHKLLSRSAKGIWTA